MLFRRTRGEPAKIWKDLRSCSVNSSAPTDMLLSSFFGENLKGSLLKGSLDKHVRIHLPVPLPLPTPPLTLPTPFPLYPLSPHFSTGKPTPTTHLNPTPNPPPPGTPVGTRTPLRKLPPVKTTLYLVSARVLSFPRQPSSSSLVPLHLAYLNLQQGETNAERKTRGWKEAMGRKTIRRGQRWFIYTALVQATSEVPKTPMSVIIWNPQESCLQCLVAKDMLAASWESSWIWTPDKRPKLRKLEKVVAVSWVFQENSGRYSRSSRITRNFGNVREHFC